MGQAGEETDMNKTQLHPFGLRYRSPAWAYCLPFDTSGRTGYLARAISVLLMICALLLSGALHAAESGTAIKGDELKTEPFRDAKTVAALAAGDKVDILRKDGGWYQVKSAKGKGWVRMLSIRKGDARKGGGDASGVLALASGRAGTGKVVATTGIRGLNEEELKAARFNEAELKRAESYATGKAAATKFAAAGKLAARPFDYLPAPK